MIMMSPYIKTIPWNVLTLPVTQNGMAVKNNKHHYSYYGKKSKNSIYTINVSKIQTMVSPIKQNKIFWITMSVFLQNFTHLLLKKDDFASEIISTHYEMMQLVWHLHRGSRVLLQA